MPKIELTSGMIGKTLSILSVDGTRLNGICVAYEGGNDSEDERDHIGIKIGDRLCHDFADNEILELLVVDHKRKSFDG